MRSADTHTERAADWPPFAIVAFAVTFAVNVAVVALWPDSDVDWAAAAVIAAAVAITLTGIRRAQGRGGAKGARGPEQRQTDR